MTTFAELCLAAREGHTERVVALTRSEPTLARLTNAQFHTPAHLAAYYGHVDTLRALLPLSDAAQGDSIGRTALHLACGRGHVDVVRLLHALDARWLGVASKPRVFGGWRLDGLSPLAAACFGGHVGVVLFLLQHGGLRALLDVRANRPAPPRASVDEPPSAGPASPPSASASPGASASVPRDPLAGYMGILAYPHTSPLHLAAAAGQTAVVALLLRAVGSVRRLRLVNSVESNHTPLSLAVSRGHLAVVDVLLEAGASADFMPALTHWPLLRACERGDDGVVASLLRSGAKFSVLASGASRGTRTVSALGVAAARGDLGLVQRLLAAGAPANDELQHTPLGSPATPALAPPLIGAAKLGAVAIVAALLAAGADVAARDTLARTALDYACLYEHEATGVLLLRHSPRSLIAEWNIDASALLAEQQQHYESRAPLKRSCDHDAGSPCGDAGVANKRRGEMSERE